MGCTELTAAHPFLAPGWRRLLAPTFGIMRCRSGGRLILRPQGEDELCGYRNLFHVRIRHGYHRLHKVSFVPR
jgi:hypothetical protein